MLMAFGVIIMMFLVIVAYRTYFYLPTLFDEKSGWGEFKGRVISFMSLAGGIMEIRIRDAGTNKAEIVHLKEGSAMYSLRVGDLIAGSWWHYHFAIRNKDLWLVTSWSIMPEN